MSTEPTDLTNYREELVLSFFSARELAAKSIEPAQRRDKKQYDKKAQPVTLKVGEWVFVGFPQVESGKQRKLSRPWKDHFE